MKAKWYYSTLLLILAVLGLSRSTIAVPNQEIVLQFSDQGISLHETKKAIAFVKNQLYSLGIEDITVHHTAGGTLKITYYSETEITHVRALLNQQTAQDPLGFALSQNTDSEERSLPESPQSYDLDIYEIHAQSNVDMDFDGYLVDLKSENDRFYTPPVFVSPEALYIKDKTKADTVAYNCYKTIVLAIDNTSYKIPEVRAGPLA